MLKLAGVLGLTLKEPERVSVETKKFIEELIVRRWELREAKQWQLADNIRHQLEELGVLLEDTPKGTVWKAKR